MTKLKAYIVNAILVVLLIAMGFLGYKAYDNALAYEETTTQMVALQGAKEQSKLQLEKLASSILGSLFEGKRVQAFEVLKQKQLGYMKEAKKYTLYFMFVLGFVLLSFFYLPLQTFSFFTTLATIQTLILGLITPVLMITIHKEVEYIGDIVLSFESKGIWGTIVKLFETGDVVVGFVILLFSVLVPVVKVLSLLFITVFLQNDFAERLVKFFKLIGKWSMVDVFVVAVFLVYLTANNADVSRAEVEVGLYFFLAYVIVSMLLSLSVDKMVQSKRVAVS